MTGVLISPKRKEAWRCGSGIIGNPLYQYVDSPSLYYFTLSRADTRRLLSLTSSVAAVTREKGREMLTNHYECATHDTTDIYTMKLIDNEDLKRS